MELPNKFLNRMKEMLGDDYNAFLKSYESENKMGLRFNPLKNTSGIFSDLKPIPWAKYGYYYTDELKPGKSVWHDLGLYYIQEPSAMSVASILDPKPTDLVLDLCAAPGGKSTQIAALMENRGLLISNEIIAKRALILADNIARLGFSNTVVTNETPDNIAAKFDGFFDKVLVDAPCSGEGMFRKNPEATTEWSEQNVAMCAERQLNILNTIKNTLKQNGILVYSTCTFSAQENEQVIEKFLQQNPNYKLVDIDHTHFSCGLIKNTETGLKDITKTVRIFPHITGGEGHYVAKMIKTDESDDNSKPLKQNIDKKSLEVLNAFFKQTKITLPSGTYLNFNNHIYICPAATPNLDKLKIQLAGLYLGEIDKNKNFIPSHNLALSTGFNNNFNQPICNKTLELNDKEFADYISGLTISTSSPLTGWTLLTHNENPIGWGKISGGQIKNHYPKHLRRNVT